jgi:hypothetical protein
VLDPLLGRARQVLSQHRSVVAVIDRSCVELETLAHQVDELREHFDGRGDETTLDA